mmetsp:Transcript_8975/g.38013  ORF Transcript_8975/g.38013 Transcript_8975/m.38013 type:complete len:258 (-) Transcript_8975:1163-1936(-)
MFRFSRARRPRDDDEVAGDGEARAPALAERLQHGEHGGARLHRGETVHVHQGSARVSVIDPSVVFSRDAPARAVAADVARVVVDERREHEVGRGGGGGGAQTTPRRLSVVIGRRDDRILRNAGGFFTFSALAVERLVHPHARQPPEPLVVGPHVKRARVAVQRHSRRRVQRRAVARGPGGERRAQRRLVRRDPGVAHAPVRVGGASQIPAGGVRLDERRPRAPIGFNAHRLHALKRLVGAFRVARARARRQHGGPRS